MRSGIAFGSTLGCGLFLLATACGGSSVSGGGTGGSAGTGALGGAGSGGSATGGSGALGGAGSGGTAVGGSGGATGGAAGMGGAAGVCGSDAKACAEPADCMLAEASCCVCGMPELGDYVAANAKYASECMCQGPACGCASMLNPNLAATCNAGSCQGFDVRQLDALSGCQTDTDCTLRMGLDCCEACAGSEWELVAVRTDAGPKLSPMLCGSGPVGCPGCIPQYPAGKTAVCIANHCQVSGGTL